MSPAADLVMKHPPKPKGREPAVWSFAAQQLVLQAQAFALRSMSDSGEPEPFDRRELYERALFRIGSDKPLDGASDAGLPIDRAHARLLLWLRLWAGISMPGDGALRLLGLDPLTLY